MTNADVVARWRALYDAPDRGRDFGELDGRVVQEAPPWSYAALARELLSGVRSVVDLGTGGGEFLQSLADVLPRDTHATEGWPPNVPVARATLRSNGILVAQYDAERDEAMPYPDERFDVVLARHEAYAAAEVARVLRPGGTFLTQQVDGRSLADLAALFGIGPAYPEVTLQSLHPAAEAAGLRVERAEHWIGAIRFRDVDTLVSYLRRMPWQLPSDFSVDGYADRLLTLERSPEPLAFTQGRFLMRCTKP